MNVDCSWKETILREKIMLTGIQSRLNNRQLECAFMSDDNGVLNLLCWPEIPVTSRKPWITARLPSGRGLAGMSGMLTFDWGWSPVSGCMAVKEGQLCGTRDVRAYHLQAVSWVSPGPTMWCTPQLMLRQSFDLWPPEWVSEVIVLVICKETQYSKRWCWFSLCSGLLIIKLVLLTF